MELKNSNGASGTLPFNEEMCESYLFGELSDADQEIFETAYFEDDAFFERFIAIKTELLDLFNRDELEPSKRARMMPHFFATAPRRQSVAESAQFTRAITAISGRQQTSANIPAVSPIRSEIGNQGWLGIFVGLFTPPRLAGALVLIGAVGAVFYLNRETNDDGVEQTLQQLATPSSADPRGETNSSELTPPESASIVSDSVDTYDNEPAQLRPYLVGGGIEKRFPSVEPTRRQPVSMAGLKNGGPGGRGDLGELSGTVLDADGKAVPRAVVTVRNLKSNEARTVVSDADGVYRFTGLPLAEYKIVSEAPNQMRTEMAPISLLASSTELRISMDAGAEASVLNVDKAVGIGRIIAANISLSASRSRDITGGNTLDLYSDTTEVNISLMLSKPEYATYGVVIETVSGQSVISIQNLRIPENASGVPLKLKPQLFEARDYLIRLSGRTKAGISEVINEYYLKVQRVSSRTPEPEPKP